MIKITVPSLGEKFLQNYTLTKKIENRFKVDELNGTVIYEGDQHKYLVEAVSHGLSHDVGELESMCGENLWSRPAKIMHTEGEFDLALCMTTKSPEFLMDLECMVDKDINIFDYTKSDTKTLQGVIDRIFDYEERSIILDAYEAGQEKLTLNDILALIPPIEDKSGEGYYVEHAQILFDPVIQTSESPQYPGVMEEGYIGHTIKLQVFYVRMFSGSQLSPEWIPTSGGYYYPIGQELNNWEPEEYYEYVLNDPSTLFRTYQQSRWEIGRSNQYVDITISNTYALNEILEDIFSCTGKELISNWYGINPDGTEPGNTAYTFSGLYCQDMKIIQSFDVIREAALEDSFAQSGIIKNKTLLKELMTLHNLIVIPGETTIHLEHITYLTRKNWDVTELDYEFSPLGLNREKIDGEVFQYAVNFNNTPWWQADIVYQTSNVFSEPNKPVIQFEKLVTDVFSAINNERYNDAEYEDKFFLVATDGTSIIGLNRSHTMPNIVLKLHPMDRPLPKAVMNGANVSFFPYSIGFEGEVKMFANILVWESLEPYMTVKTRFGSFLITEITYNDAKELVLKTKK